MSRVSGVVRAAPDKVFRFLADLENWPRWQSDMRTTTLVEGQRGQPGACYRYLSKAMGQTFDSTVRVPESLDRDNGEAAAGPRSED